MLSPSSLASRRYLLSSLLSLGFAFRLARPTLASTACPSNHQSGIKMASSTCESHQFVVGYVTIKDSKHAEELATKLVNENLVACVNIVPSIRSIYRWEGKVENDSEALMILKTSSARSGDVVSFVKANHPYEVPEVIFTPILSGNPAYMKWLGESVRASPSAESGDGK